MNIPNTAFWLLLIIVVSATMLAYTNRPRTRIFEQQIDHALDDDRDRDQEDQDAETRREESADSFRKGE